MINKLGFKAISVYSPLGSCEAKGDIYKNGWLNLFNYPLIKRANFIRTTRLYSTKINKDINIPSNSTNSIIFSDADKDKLAILETSKGRSGIYMSCFFRSYANKLNGQKYVGSCLPISCKALAHFVGRRNYIGEEVMSIRSWKIVKIM